MMPEKRCRCCGENFNFDANDVRPFIYHNCQDDSLCAHENPNNIRQKTQMVYTKKKKIIWQDFNGYKNEDI